MKEQDQSKKDEFLEPIWDESNDVCWPLPPTVMRPRAVPLFETSSSGTVRVIPFEERMRREKSLED